MKAKTQVTVREATQKDFAGIVEVLESTKLQNQKWTRNRKWVKKAREKLLGTENYKVLVAESDGKIVGFISYAVFPSLWECSDQGLIIDFFVQEAFQGKGAGAKLLEAAIKQADAARITELHVSTERENEPARRLYAKFGFTEEQLLLERERKNSHG